MPDADENPNATIEAAARACEEMARFRAREGAAALKVAAEQIRALRQQGTKNVAVKAMKAAAACSRAEA